VLGRAGGVKVSTEQNFPYELRLVPHGSLGATWVRHSSSLRLFNHVHRLCVCYSAGICRMLLTLRVIIGIADLRVYKFLRICYFFV